MADLTICTWLWGHKYTAIYVERLFAGLFRHLTCSFRFLLMTERHRKLTLSQAIERHDIEDVQLTEIRGCFARLRMFDPEWQRKLAITGSIVCLDLDVVITGPLDPIFDRRESVVLLSGANASNPCPFNGSIFMFQADAHADLWFDFSLDVVRSIRKYEFPDDQGWFWHKVPNAATWKVGASSGIYAFRKPNWPPSDKLPKDARIVVFPGHRDPAQFTHLDWIREHWR